MKSLTRYFVADFDKGEIKIKQTQTDIQIAVNTIQDLFLYTPMADKDVETLSEAMKILRTFDE